MISKSQVIQIIEATPKNSLIAVDEAYIEFEKGESLVNLINQYSNLLVFRTLSKAYSLASLRVGFAMGCSDLIERLIPFQAPYPIPSIVRDYIVSNFNGEYIKKIEEEVLRIQRWRRCLKKYFDFDGGNFLYRKIEDAENMTRKFQQEGMIIRCFPAQGAIRISIGTDAEMKKVEELCEKLL